MKVRANEGSIGAPKIKEQMNVENSAKEKSEK